MASLTAELGDRNDRRQQCEPVLFPAAPRRTAGQLQLAFEIGTATTACAHQRTVAGVGEIPEAAAALPICCTTTSRPTTAQPPAPAAEGAAAIAAATSVHGEIGVGVDDEDEDMDTHEEHADSDVESVEAVDGTR